MTTPEDVERATASETYRARVDTGGRCDRSHLLKSATKAAAKREARQFAADVPSRGAVWLDVLANGCWRPVSRLDVDGLSETTWVDE